MGARRRHDHQEIEADIASDPDEAGMVVDWGSVSIELPKAKADLHKRIDRDVLEFFRKTGRGYQTRIKFGAAVLCRASKAQMIGRPLNQHLVFSPEGTSRRATPLERSNGQALPP